MLDTSFDEKAPVVVRSASDSAETVELTNAAASAVRRGMAKPAAPRKASIGGSRLSGGILSKLPNDTPFQQQKLKAWQPTLSPTSVVALFTIISIIFLPIGIGLFFATRSLVDIEIRYDQKMSEPCLSNSPVNSCYQQINVTIPEDMDGPVYFYYKLSNYYQNHRIYVSSRSDYQLKGDSSPDISTCIPSSSKSNSKDQTLYPCGLIANSFFSDKFGANLCRVGASNCMNLGNLTGNSDENPYWKKKGIAWSGDVSERFKLNTATINDLQMKGNQSLYSRISPFTGREIPLPTDEDLMVWMRVAALPTFRKLYRIIQLDLKKNDILQITIDNNYLVDSYNGEKSIFISNTNALGGKNNFLAYCYIIVGAMTGIFAFLFHSKNQRNPIRLEESDIEMIMEREKLWRPEKLVELNNGNAATNKSTESMESAALAASGAAAGSVISMLIVA